ncbi:MAG: hypothetical protein ABI334_09620 [Candidatus Dormiibacterota bacterium]
MSSDERPPFDSFLVRSLVTLVIPQGYTLSIAGTFAVAVHRYGFPADPEALGFVAAAVAAFVALAVIARRGLSGSIVALPTGLLALINVVPVVVVLAVAGVIVLVKSPSVGFLLAGFIGAGGYVLLVSGFLWLMALADAAPREKSETT